MTAKLKNISDICKLFDAKIRKGRATSTKKRLTNHHIVSRLRNYNTCF